MSKFRCERNVQYWGEAEKASLGPLTSLVFVSVRSKQRNPSPSLVPVYMMHIRDVLVSVPHPAMLVEMGMRFSRRVRSNMHVSMMFVVNVRMLMRHRVVNVFVLMMLSQM